MEKSTLSAFLNGGYVSSDFDKQFNEIMKEFQIVEPLSTVSLLEGTRCLVEANLYIQDYLAEFFGVMNDAVSSIDVDDEDKEEDVIDSYEEILLDLPGFSHKATVYLITMFNAAKAFCETVTKEMEQ